MSFRLRQRGKDNNCTLPGCAAPNRYSRSSSSDQNQPKHAKHASCTQLSEGAHWHVQLQASLYFFKAGFDSRWATPCRLRPRWSLPDRYTAAGGPKRRASSLKNKSRPSTTVLKSEFSIRGNTLPALMSRSSWFACPSCCEVAMFPPLAADSHWLLTVWITPQLRQNLNETNHARMYKSIRKRHRKSSLRPPSAA